METVSYYVKGLFRGVEETNEVREQKEELVQHIQDHIRDLTKTGLSEQEAFEKTVAGLSVRMTFAEQKKRGSGVVYRRIFQTEFAVFFCISFIGLLYDERGSMAITREALAGRTGDARSWYMEAAAQLRQANESGIQNVKSIETALSLMEQGITISTDLF